MGLPAGSSALLCPWNRTQGQDSTTKVAQLCFLVQQAGPLWVGRAVLSKSSRSLPLCQLMLEPCWLQGPRGLPGERGRTGPAGAAVSNPQSQLPPYTEHFTVYQ